MFIRTSFHFRPGRTVRLIFGTALLAAMAQPASAVFIDPSIAIPTQLLSFGPIQGDAFLPLTNAGNSSTESGAPAATADGYGWVKTNIAISLSTTHTSTGDARLSVPFNFPTGAAGTVAAAAGQSCIEGGTAGNVANGDSVCVNSFFDVFFDVSLTDIDASAGFFGGLGPALISVVDLGPANMQQNSTCIADTSKDNLGCLPPSGSAYIGHFQVVLPLGVDINGAGGPDVIKFDFVQHQVGDVTNTFVDGTKVVDTFNSTIDGGGGVMDSAGDPPFTFTLTGPTTAQQGIVFPAQVPEPATLLLFGTGLGLLGWKRRRIAS